MKYKLKYLILAVLILIISNCSTSVVSSMEFRSAKTSARSEKNLKKAEEWGLQALDLEIHASDPAVPYFLAIEIYKPQMRWDAMAKMLNEAIKRNPNQLLERPINLDGGKRLTTIQEGVNIYREQLWVNLYNEASSLYENGNEQKAIDRFNLALEVDPSNIQTYIVLAKIYKQKGSLNESKKIINKASNIEDLNQDVETELLLIKAEILRDENNTEEAIENYKIAYNKSNSITAILSILEVNLLNENYIEAIEWGNKAMQNRAQLDRSFFGHLLYNIGLAYRGAGSFYYDDSANIINRINDGETISLSTKTEGLNLLKLAKENFSSARDFFLDADVEDMEDAGDRAKQMKDIIKEINSIYIPFFENYTPRN